MGWSRKIKEKVLVATGRRCAICHSFCGKKIALHHIIQEADGGKNTFENCIPLCLSCHADMGNIDKRHPIGTQYSSEELCKHRDEWYEQVKKNNASIQVYEAKDEQDEQEYSKEYPKKTKSLSKFNDFENITLDTVNKLIESRIIIEKTCFENSFDKIESEDILSLKKILQKMESAKTNRDVYGFAKYDMDFHIFLASTSDNSFLPNILNDLSTIFLFQQNLFVSFPEIMEAALLAHQNILRSIEERNYDQSMIFLQKHLGNVKRNWETILTKLSNSGFQDDRLDTIEIVYRIRQTIECNAIRNFKKSFTTEDKKSLLRIINLSNEAYIEGNLNEYLRHNIEFHYHIATSHSIVPIKDISSQIYSLSEIILRIILSSPKIVDSNISIHKAILYSLVKENFAESEKLMYEHLESELNLWKSMTK